MSSSASSSKVKNAKRLTDNDSLSSNDDQTTFEDYEFYEPLRPGLSFHAVPYNYPSTIYSSHPNIPWPFPSNPAPITVPEHDTLEVPTDAPDTVDDPNADNDTEDVTLAAYVTEGLPNAADVTEDNTSALEFQTYIFELAPEEGSALIMANRATASADDSKTTSAFIDWIIKALSM